MKFLSANQQVLVNLLFVSLQISLIPSYCVNHCSFFLKTGSLVVRFWKSHIPKKTRCFQNIVFSQFWTTVHKMKNYHHWNSSVDQLLQCSQRFWPFKQCFWSLVLSSLSGWKVSRFNNRCQNFDWNGKNEPQERRMGWIADTTTNCWVVGVEVVEPAQSLQGFQKTSGTTLSLKTFSQQKITFAVTWKWKTLARLNENLNFTRVWAKVFPSLPHFSIFLAHYGKYW